MTRPVAEVVVLGSLPVAIDPAVPREEPGRLDALLALPPRAVIVADRGEGCFFRASLAFERGVSRVVIRPGAISEAWVSELAARANELGGELWLRDDTKYQRVKGERRPTRIEVGAPSAFAPVIEAATDPLPLVARNDVRCEEIAFAIGLKPVLYLVVDEARIEAVLAEHPRAVTMSDRLETEGRSGARNYGAGKAVRHVFVGSEAARAADLWSRGSSENVTELGALMGYPRCCVRAFAAMASRSINSAFPWVTAARTRAFAEPFDVHLDTTVSRLVPFVPCSYACPRAIEWARRVAEASGIDIHPQRVLFIDETRALVVDDATLEEGAITYRNARFVGEADDPMRRIPRDGVIGAGAVLLPFERSAMLSPR